MMQQEVIRGREKELGTIRGGKCAIKKVVVKRKSSSIKKISCSPKERSNMSCLHLISERCSIPTNKREKYVGRGTYADTSSCFYLCSYWVKQRRWKDYKIVSLPSLCHLILYVGSKCYGRITKLSAPSFYPLILDVGSMWQELHGSQSWWGDIFVDNMGADLVWGVLWCGKTREGHKLLGCSS